MLGQYHHHTVTGFLAIGFSLMLWGGMDEILRMYHLVKLDDYFKITRVTFEKYLKDVNSLCLGCSKIITTKFKGLIRWE